MLCWAHYKFRQRLIAKAEELGVCVIIQNEAYTSKTCSWCGKIQKIGGSEVYNCRNCGTVMDRDENGARESFSGHCLMEPWFSPEIMQEIVVLLSNA